MKASARSQMRKYSRYCELVTEADTDGPCGADEIEGLGFDGTKSKEIHACAAGGHRTVAIALDLARSAPEVGRMALGSTRERVIPDVAVQ